MQAINAIREAGSLRKAVESGILREGIMYECIKNNVELVLAGSVRDDGPLPDVIMDLAGGPRRVRGGVKGVTMALMIATMLHSIATGNLLPASVKVVAVDINPAGVTKLADRGTFQGWGVGRVGEFLGAGVGDGCGIICAGAGAGVEDLRVVFVSRRPVESGKAFMLKLTRRGMDAGGEKKLSGFFGGGGGAFLDRARVRACASSRRDKCESGRTLSAALQHAHERENRCCLPTRRSIHTGCPVETGFFSARP